MTDQTQAENVRRLPLLPTLFAYGAPAVPANALLVIYAFFPVYYTQGLGISFGVAAAMVLFTRLWDVVTDPLIGILSDRTQLKLGRRKPWMLAALPILIPSVYAVFFADPGADPLGLALWTMALYLGWTMVTLPLNAWTVELSGDYHQRSRISAVREALSLVGTLVALGLLAGAAGISGTGGDITGERIQTAFSHIGWALIALFPLTVAAAVWLVPDRPSLRRSARRSWLDLKDLAKNKPLRQVMLAFGLNGVANGLPPALFVFFVQAVIGAPGDVGTFILIYFVLGIAGVPLWTQVAKKIGKHRTWMWAMAIAAISFVPAAFLGEGDWWLYLGVVIATGLCLGPDFFLPSAISADVVDQDEVMSGQERAGMFFSLYGMIYKLSQAIAGGGALLVLDLAGFRSEAGTQNSELALTALALTYAVVPALFKVGAIAVMRGFSLDETAQEALRKQIAQERAADA